MATNKMLLLIVAAVVAVIGLGGGLVIWPAYRESYFINRRIVILLEKARDLTAQTREIEEFGQQLDELRHRSGTQLKSVPEAPDVGGLIRKLSLPVDEITLKDQQFVAGQPSPAAHGDDVSMLAMPLTVEMTATFDTIFALLQSVESMDRLVRVTTVRINCKRPNDCVEDITQLESSLGLEAIYEAAAEPAPEEVK